MTSFDQSHVGKRVRWEWGGESGTGVLMGKAGHGSLLVQDDRQGWTANTDHISVKEGLVLAGTKNLYFICSYELMDITLENMEPGQLVKDSGGDYHKVLAVIPGEKGKRIYVISTYDSNKEGADLEKVGEMFSPAELEANDYTPVTDEDDTIEMTLEEVAKLKGVPVEKLRIRE